MKKLGLLLCASVATVAALAAGPATAQSLPGVSDEETVIRSGRPGPREIQLGKRDVIFARDRTNRWYRVQLNRGCLSGNTSNISFAIGPDGLIDRSTKVVLASPRSTCVIDSIRASAPPPQVDSRSPVTLD